MIESEQTLSVNCWTMDGSRNGGLGTPVFVRYRTGVRA